MPLITLNCSRTSVSDISSLQNCRTLKHLDLQYTKIPEEYVIAIRKAISPSVTPFVPQDRGTVIERKSKEIAIFCAQLVKQFAYT